MFATTRRPISTTLRSRVAAIGLAALLGSQSAPLVAASTAGPASGTGPVPAAPAAGLEPSIHWEDARRHERDRIEFAPGGRVTVGFEPRSTDRWAVGGAAPRSLPAGRLDGRSMRQAGAKPPPQDVQGDRHVDQPIVDSESVVPAAPAAWTAPAEPPTIGPAARVDPGGLRREVFGFLPYWQLNSSSLRIQYDKISTIAYFGVGADAKGNLQKRNSNGTTTTGWSGWTSSKLTSIINEAHASGTRVVLTVQSFAWNSSGRARQKALLGSSSARYHLARQIAAAVRDRGADGVNLDFEPLVSGAEGQFTSLVRTIRAELDRVAKGYQLTFDTTGFIGNYPIERATAPGGADAIFIMGYDYRGAASSPVGSVAPLTKSGYDIRDTVAAYTARVSPSKLILGVPYYGRAWSTATNLVHARNISGTRYGASAAVIYTSALPFLAEHGKRYDAGEQVAWTVYRRQHCTGTYGCMNPWRQLYVDDARSLGAKYDLVNRAGLRGVGIWALGYDGTRPELWGALEAKFIADTVPPTIRSGSVSAAVFSPNGDGRLDTSTVRMSVSGLVRWGYRVQAIVGTGRGPNLRSGTVENKTVAFTWNGLDSSSAVVPDGSYRVTLWADDASANRSAWATTVVVDTRQATVTPTVNRGFLTPDRDARAETLPFSWSSSEVVAGAVRVRDSGRTVQRAWSFGAGSRGGVAWDGRGPDRRVVADGRYIFELDGRDRAGNRTVVSQPFIVDRTIRSVGWSDGSFDPRAGRRSQLRIDLRRAAVVSVRIYRGGTAVRTVWTDRSLPAGMRAWNWDGRSAGGAYVAPGTYRVVVWARSWVGTTWYQRNVVVEAH